MNPPPFVIREPTQDELIAYMDVIRECLRRSTNETAVKNTAFGISGIAQAYYHKGVTDALTPSLN